MEILFAGTELWFKKRNLQSLNSDIITLEMAQFAVNAEQSCLQLVPDPLKIQEMCTETVKNGLDEH